MHGSIFDTGASLLSSRRGRGPSERSSKSQISFQLTQNWALGVQRNRPQLQQPHHGGLEHKGEQEQQLKESKRKPHRTGCSLLGQVLAGDGDRAEPVLHSLQKRSHSTAGMGTRAQPPCADKAQASAHLTAQQEDREKCGVGAGSPGVHPQTLPPLQPHTSPHLCFELKVCSS